MCGLAGAIRRKNSSDFGNTKEIVSDLLFEIKHRGPHATGLATITPQSGTITKWAVDPNIVIPSQQWTDLMAGIGRETVAFLGHVRFATFDNAREDAAAHP